MSSLSPRASISGNASAAVSEDFADSLRDLTQNNRYEISNLTIIAKENTEHAQAISKALESHIKTVRHQFAMTNRNNFQVPIVGFLLFDSGLDADTHNRQHQRKSCLRFTSWIQ
jgi:hypothetical protein